MKNPILFLTIFFLALPLFAKQEPLVKFYLNGGSTKQYNISNIDTIGIIKSNSNYVMKIFYSDTLIAYYPTEVITKIQFEYDSLKNQVLNVYICGYPKTYSLFFIDSIYFYTDIYQPLTIGSQVWMLKNLNVGHYRNGDSIPEVINDHDWWLKASDGWCFYNIDSSLGRVYGKLYNWYAVNDSRGLAPKGWHIVSCDEWDTLITFLGGVKYAGLKLKEQGTLHWNLNDINVSNESGFSALPGGFRYLDGVFGYIGDVFNLWSSDFYYAGNAYSLGIGLNNSVHLGKDFCYDI